MGQGYGQPAMSLVGHKSYRFPFAGIDEELFRVVYRARVGLGLLQRLKFEANTIPKNRTAKMVKIRVKK